MKNKKMILIVVLLLIFVLVAIYMTIDKIYKFARKDNIECCSCCGKDEEVCIDACCECNYNIFKKLSYILYNK